MPGPPPAASTAEQSLQLLKEGNARFVADESHFDGISARRLELVAGQNPFAIVLGCSDSRVPIETVFDQLPGNLFVVRVAGNFLDDNGLASIEYSVSILGSSLIVVLGHSGCGAVDATLQYLRNGTVQPGHIQRLVAAIEPAAAAVRDEDGDWWDNAVAENVRLNAASIVRRSEIVTKAVESGKLRVVGGVYDLHGGKVSFL
ncbi:MAG TPA: carbonic anhydrase [Candidatus Acidoferrales bacterium]|nr:carbonic anhydrase [Candidatus Acidoferrales bacterium]